MREKPVTTFSNRLKEIMELKKKRQIDIHNDCNISKSIISQWLAGKTRALNTEHLYTLGKYFNVSETWLMGYDVPMQRSDNEALANYAKSSYAKDRLSDKDEIIMRMDTLNEDELKRLKDMIELMFPKKDK